MSTFAAFSSISSSQQDIPKDGAVRPGETCPRPMYGDEAKTNATLLRNWQLRRIPYAHPYRMRLATTWRRSDLFKMGYMWLRRSFNGMDALTMHYSVITFDNDDDDAIPTPNYQEFAPPLDNEAARLGKPNYEPYARFDEGADLKTRTAAKLNEEVLQDELRRQNWDETARRMNMHIPLYGQALMVSRWLYDYEDTTRYPVVGAMKCPSEGCTFKVANPELTEEQAGQLPTHAYEVEQDDQEDGGGAVKRTLTNCPTCETSEQEVDVPTPNPVTGEMELMPQMQTFAGGPKLASFTPIDDELYGQDYFGSELGEDVPNGKWSLECLSPYDHFAENLGIDVNNQTIQEQTIVEVKTLEWFTRHFANGWRVKAEAPEDIMRYHPIAGERQLFYGNAAVMGAADGLFRHHCRLRSTYKKPWRQMKLDENNEPIRDRNGWPVMEMNQGRALLMAGDVVLYDGDLKFESNREAGLYIARAHVECIVFEERSGGREYYGGSMSERLFDVVENICEQKSQIIDARETHGQPKWLTARGLNFDFNNAAEAGSIWEYDADPLMEAFIPREVGNTLLNSEVYKETEFDLEYIQRASNKQAVDEGNVPKGVAAALAIQMLSEQTQIQRQPRMDAIKAALERLFTHGMTLNHELVLDTRSIWKEPDGPGDWEQSAWTGEDLQGMTDIHIKAEPAHEDAIQKQQMIRDLLDAQLFDLTDPRVRRRLAKAMGADGDIFEDQERQEESAEIEYLRFRDDNIPPMVEEEIDEDQVHYDRHTYDVTSPWCRDLEDRAAWKTEVLPLLAGWNYPVGAPQPNGMVDQMTGQPQMVPQDTPFGLFLTVGPGGMLPDQLELRILGCWIWMLSKKGFKPRPEQQEPLMWVMRFRAHIAAHKINAQKDAAATQAGMPIMQPGGAPAAADGTMMAGAAAPQLAGRVSPLLAAGPGAAVPGATGGMGPVDRKVPGSAAVPPPGVALTPTADMGAPL